MTRRHELALLDADILRALLSRGDLNTYVIRNMLVSQHEAKQAWPGLKTSRVLTACRRLEKAGAVKPAPTSYLVDLAWAITDRGRLRLQIVDELVKLAERVEAQKAETLENLKFYGGDQWPS